MDQRWLGLAALTGCRMDRLRRLGPGGGERPHGSALAWIARAEGLPDRPTVANRGRVKGSVPMDRHWLRLHALTGCPKRIESNNGLAVGLPGRRAAWGL